MASATTSAKRIGPHTPIAHVTIGVNFAPPSICRSVCSADRFADRGFFSICWLMNCRQSTRWLITTVTPMLNSVSRTTGSTQLGFLTMSSNVAFGEKNTPTIRPIGLIAGCDCASGAGIDAVAIEVPPPRSAFAGAQYRRSTPHCARTPEKFRSQPRNSAGTPGRCCSGESGGKPPHSKKAAARLQVSTRRQFRHSSEQLLRVWMRRTVQDLLYRAHFHELPCAHHRYARRHLRHNRQAVRDNYVLQPKTPLHLPQQS